MQASPGAHNTYVRSIDQDLSHKVKPLIRFIKAWKYFQNVPISSFYLELRVAKYASNESSIVYSIDVKNVFALLDDLDLAPIRDPMGVSGLIRRARLLLASRAPSRRSPLHYPERPRHAKRKRTGKK